MRWFRLRYSDGYQQAQRDAQEHYAQVCQEYERLLSEAREGLATKEAERAAAVTRGDLLMDRLLADRGIRGVSAITREAEQIEREATARLRAELEQPAETFGDMIDPLAQEPDLAPKETTH